MVRLFDKLTAHSSPLTTNGIKELPFILSCEM